MKLTWNWHKTDGVDEIGLNGVKADVLAKEGREDVEDVPVEIPHGPLGPDVAAEEADGPTPLCSR